MTATAEARQTTVTSMNYGQRKRLSRLLPNRRKPRYSAVFAHLAALRRVRAAAYDCIKDGIFIDFACGTGGFLVSALKELDKQVKTPADREQYNTAIYGVDSKPLPHLLCVTNMLLHDIDSPVIVNANSLEKNVREYREADRFDVILMNPPYGGSELESVKQNFPAELRSSETADLFMTLIMYRLKTNGRAAVIIPDGFLTGRDAKATIRQRLITEFNLHTVIRMPPSVFAPYTDIATNILFFDRSGKTNKTWFYRVDMPDGYKHFSKTKPMKLEHFASAIEWWNSRQPLILDGFDKSRCCSFNELKEQGFNLDICSYPHADEEIPPPQELILNHQTKSANLYADIAVAMSKVSAIFNGQASVGQPKSLLVLMKELADIYDTFPSMLRKSILQAAVQGKLVSQDESESAIDVPAYGADTPFDVPDNWVWCRLEDVCSYIQRGKSPKYSIIKQIPVIAQKCNQWSGFSIEKAQFIDPDSLSSYAEQRLLQHEDLMWNSTGLGTLGRLAIYKTELNPYGIAVADSHVTVIRASKDKALPQYLFNYLACPIVQETIESKSDGSTKQKELATRTVKNYPIPLPPLGEQQRIVAKVNELMAAVEG